MLEIFIAFLAHLERMQIWPNQIGEKGIGISLRTLEPEHTHSTTNLKQQSNSGHYGVSLVHIRGRSHITLRI